MKIVDNNTLLITQYRKHDHNTFPSFLYQCSKQGVKCDLLNIFTKCESTEQFYSQYIYNNSIDHKCFFQHYDNEYIKFNDLLKPYLNQYNNFLFVHPSHLLSNNFLKSLSHTDLKDNSYNIYCSRDKSAMPIFYFDQSGIIDLFRKDYNLSMILWITANNPYIVVDSFNIIPIIKPQDQDLDNYVIYENEFFLLCKLEESPTQEFSLVDSYIYINKRNNRVYNIVNNIVGEIILMDRTKLKIQWMIDSDKIIVDYTLDQSAKFYKSNKMTNLK